MKEKKLKIGLFCVIVILAIIGLYQVADYEVRTSTLQESTLQASSTSTGTLVSGETDPTTYSYNIDTGTWSAIYGSTSAGDALLPGFELYCINPGMQLNLSYDSNYSKISVGSVRII